MTRKPNSPAVVCKTTLSRCDSCTGLYPSVAQLADATALDTVDEGSNPP